MNRKLPHLAFRCPMADLGGAPPPTQKHTPLGALKADQDLPPDLRPSIGLPPSIQKCWSSKIGKGAPFLWGICGCQATPMDLLPFSHSRGYHACRLGPPGHVPLAAGELSLNPGVLGYSPFLPLWGLSRKRAFSGGGEALCNLHLKTGEAAFGSEGVFLLWTFLFGAFLYIEE